MVQHIVSGLLREPKALRARQHGRQLRGYGAAHLRRRSGKQQNGDGFEWPDAMTSYLATWTVSVSHRTTKWTTNSEDEKPDDAEGDAADDAGEERNDDVLPWRCTPRTVQTSCQTAKKPWRTLRSRRQGRCLRRSSPARSGDGRCRRPRPRPPQAPARPRSCTPWPTPLLPSGKVDRAGPVARAASRKALMKCTAVFGVMRGQS